jgi:hypothetical protein
MSIDARVLQCIDIKYVKEVLDASMRRSLFAAHGEATPCSRLWHCELSEPLRATNAAPAGCHSARVLYARASSPDVRRTPRVLTTLSLALIR